MNKLCFLVGGSRGLGKSLLQRYRDDGFEVVEFSRQGTGEGHVDLDLSRRETAIDTVDAHFSKHRDSVRDDIHLIINAAVIGPLGPLAQSEPKDWWAHLDINMVLPISIAGRFQHQFADHPARRVVAFVSSGAATQGIDGWSLYCATKAGVEHFIRTMALEQQRLKNPMLCLNLNPGVMATDMQASIRQATEEQFSGLQHFVDLHRNGELGKPDVVADNLFNVMNSRFESGCTVDVS